MNRNNHCISHRLHPTKKFTAYEKGGPHPPTSIHGTSETPSRAWPSSKTYEYAKTVTVMRRSSRGDEGVVEMAAEQRKGETRQGLASAGNEFSSAQVLLMAFSSRQQG